MEFMAESGEDPFFIQIAFQKPHHPLLPSQRFWEMYPEDIALPPTAHSEPAGRPPHFRAAWERFQNRNWDYGEDGESSEAGQRRAWRGTLACITQIDDVFSRLLAFLDDQGLAENTIVIYSSDHGAYHGIHGIEEKAPGICSDAVCRVPMIWRVPGVTKPGTLVDDLVEAVDMAATLPGLCGLEPMDSVDGLDISPLLGRVPGDSPADQADTRGQRFPDAGACAVTENVYAKAIRWDNWRMVYYPEAMFDGTEYGELYDLEKDPDERTNLYDDRPEIVRQGMRVLTEWLVTTTRIVTTQPAVRIDGSTGRDVGGTRSYPTSSDGKAPNWVQPRRRTDTNVNYL
jgi:arylsulfatase A-like enzyme